MSTQNQSAKKCQRSTNYEYEDYKAKIIFLKIKTTT